MLKATMAFFGLLHVGEYTYSTISDAIIYRQNVHLMKDAVKLRTSDAKTGKGQIQCIEVQSRTDKLCPVKALKSY